MDAYSRPTRRIARRRPDSLEKIKKSARKLFVERGYHATRPQDIARDAGVGHGTFYLHYEDKRACFLAFVEDTRSEFYEFIRVRMGQSGNIEQTIVRTLMAVYEYSDANPGLLSAAIADLVLIDGEDSQCGSLIRRWGRDWAQMIRDSVRHNMLADIYDADVLGQAIVGAIRQCCLDGDRAGVPRDEVVRILARFLARGLNA